MPKPEKVIETSPIRLTADETRAVMKAATAAPKPISDYRCCGLVDLGIMKLIPIESADNTAGRKECWKLIREAAVKQDRDVINEQSRLLRNFDEQERKKEKGYVLTELGKQVARGVKVSLNSQFKQVPC
jgi:hypothetical protein